MALRKVHFLQVPPGGASEAVHQLILSPLLFLALMSSPAHCTMGSVAFSLL